jgi:preprotein translocase subunit SecA
MTALYFALRNKKVDVFTSSSNLAMTETNHDSSVRKLFNIFDISLADVCRDRLSQRHRPYTCQVIYGTSFEFQADYLTKVFTGNNLFFLDRNFDENHVAILDEVDALLIDRMRDSTRLSSQKPLFECIKTILILINEVKK